MTKDEFKLRWESDADGGGITFDEVARCAKSWGLCAAPKTRPPGEVLYSVLSAAGTNDAEFYRGDPTEDKS